MQITCGTCGRDFEIDETLTAKLNAARCVCGVRVSLQPTPAGAAPRRLGKYVLQRRVAVGGMGEIYLGKIAGVEGFEREVAIKKMLPHLSADRDFINMMVKEAKLTVLLNHPNIVQVYDLAKEGNEYYIAMEYVPGINLGKLLERCRHGHLQLPVEVAAFIAVQTLRGLHYAHDLRGPDGAPMHVLHRDITPQNVLVTQAGWVKITDFGIAKARNEISTTSPGMIKGKLGYIAPEQLTGMEVDQRVDIFCAGIVLWESLAVRRLFKGQSEIDTFRLISEAVVPSLAAIRDDVPDAVEEVIAKALARKPEDRFTTANQFADALTAAMAPRSIDDLGAVTRQFFAGKPELFVAEPSEDDGIGGDQPTVEITGLDVTTLPEISTLVVGRGGAGKSAAGKGAAAGASTSRRAPLMLFAAIVVLGAGAFAGFQVWRRGVNKPPVAAAEGLSTAEVQMAVDGETSRLSACYRQASGELPALGAKLTIPSTGGVSEIILDPAAAELGKVGACVEGVLRQLKFRSHGLPMLVAQVTLPPPEKIPSKGSDVGRPSKGGQPRSAKDNEPLTQAEIQSTVKANQVAIVRCLEGVERASAPPQVNAQVTIETTGKVSEVALSPTLQPDSAQQCLTRSLRGMRFRRQPVNDFKVTIPLKIQVL